MPRPPTTIADFIALPVELRSRILPPATHYIYLHPYEPKHPSPDSPRSLFLVNIPITTTSTHLKHLLTTQLDGGRIEHIHFARDNTDGTNLIANPPASISSEITTEKSKKRKRPAEQIPVLEHKLSEIHMPSTAPTPIHRTGSSAVVVFLDRTSRDLTLRNAKRHVHAAAKKSGKPIVWGQGIPEPPPMGLARYTAMKDLVYPSDENGGLLALANEYMGVYAELEDARSKENARKRAVVDEDGFVTVTKGSRGGVSAEEVARREGMAKKRKSDGLGDFYRFQMRDRRRDAGDDLRRKFGEDRKRVREMMDRRRSSG